MHLCLSNLSFHTLLFVDFYWVLLSHCTVQIFNCIFLQHIQPIFHILSGKKAQCVPKGYPEKKKKKKKKTIYIYIYILLLLYTCIIVHPKIWIVIFFLAVWTVILTAPILWKKIHWWSSVKKQTHPHLANFTRGSIIMDYGDIFREEAMV